MSAVAAAAARLALLQPQPGGPLELAGATDPAALSRQHARLRADRVARRPGRRPALRRGRGARQGRVRTARACRRSRCSAPRGRSIERCLTRLGRDPGRSRPRSHALRDAVATAAAAVAERGHRRQPWPRRGPHGRATGPRTPRSTSRQHGERPDRRDRRRGRHASPSSTAATTTPCAVRPRTPASTAWSSPTPRGRDTSEVPRLGDRGLRDGVRGDRGGSSRAPRPDVVVVPIGVGALAAAVVRHVTGRGRAAAADRRRRADLGGVRAGVGRRRARSRPSTTPRTRSWPG